MKKVAYNDIVERIAQICQEANTVLPEDTVAYYNNSLQNETDPGAKSLFSHYIENMNIAREDSIPVCQDTGTAVFFVTLGRDVVIEGNSGLMEDAINDGVRKGYGEGYLRKSIVSDPLFDRKNTGDNTPAVVHLKTGYGEECEIIFAPKGGGAENMSRLYMLAPSEGVEGVIRSVVTTVTEACANPCPPVVVGVGVGGNFECAPFLAKRALVRQGISSDERYARLEKEILGRLNQTGIGPQGFGGDISAFDVKIEYAPCHIASLPVAVNLNCHVHRHMHVSF